MRDKGARLEFYYRGTGAELYKVKGKLAYVVNHGNIFPVGIESVLERLPLLTHGFSHTPFQSPRGTTN